MNSDYPVPRHVSTPCREQDPELWFSENPPIVKQAKAECLRCPFTSACLAYALPRALEGIWGATDTKERKALQQRAGIVPQPIVTLPQRWKGAA